MSDANTTKPMNKINTHDFTKQPFGPGSYADMRGIVDWGNLLQFAPYESGYSFLCVINGPSMAYDTATLGKDKNFTDLQNAFIKILEQEFRGLSGIENISSETMEITDGITSISLLGKVNQPTNSQISMEFTEKSGITITKYISTYLRYVRDPKTQVKTYGGKINGSNAATHVTLAKEVFNFLYIITDNTCLNIEKAFLILNAQPTEANYSDLFNAPKGEVQSKDISVNFNAFVVDGVIPNRIALVYMRNMINPGEFKKGLINVNSYEMDWSISGVGPGGEVGHISDLNLKKNNDTGYNFVFDESGSDIINVYAAVEGMKDNGTYQEYNPGKD